jgi:hypothetical protein
MKDMKRDLDLLRKILLEIESWPDASQPRDVNLTSYSDEIVSEHVSLLFEAHYIEAQVIQSQAGKRILPIRLTWQGHELLDEARNAPIAT